jgi:hypothetical protein
MRELFVEWMETNTRENEYRIRSLIRRMPSLSGMGEKYEYFRRELMERLQKAATYRDLTPEEEIYLKPNVSPGGEETPGMA